MHTIYSLGSQTNAVEKTEYRMRYCSSLKDMSQQPTNPRITFMIVLAFLQTQGNRKKKVHETSNTTPCKKLKRKADDNSWSHRVYYVLVLRNEEYVELLGYLGTNSYLRRWGDSA